MTKEELSLRIEQRGKVAIAPFPRLGRAIGFGAAALGGQALGGLLQEGLGNDDISTVQGKEDRVNNQLKARGIGALAGILAGAFLMRRGRMKSFKMYR